MIAAYPFVFIYIKCPPLAVLSSSICLNLPQSASVFRSLLENPSLAYLMSLHYLLNGTPFRPLIDGKSEISPWYVSCVVTAILLVIFMYGMRESYPDLPRLDPRRPTELTTSKRRAEFCSKSQELLAQGTQRFQDKPYKVYSENGDVVIIPSKYVDELRNDPKLSFAASAEDVSISS